MKNDHKTKNIRSQERAVAALAIALKNMCKLSDTDWIDFAKKLDFNKASIFLLGWMEYEFHITLGGKTPNGNDRLDMFNLLYVNNDLLYWTEEKGIYRTCLL